MRLFAAIGIPADITESLLTLPDGLPGADWTEADNYHVTLRFIGEVGRAQAEEIDAALAAIVAPGFNLQLATIGLFSTGRRPRTLWVGVEPDAKLIELARRIDRAVVATGVEPETRKLTPHVTIARLKDASMGQVMQFVTENALFRAPSFTVDHFTLYESRQGRGGSVYFPLADYPLLPAS